MKVEKQDRIAGMAYGSLAADALALGAHWIYDQEELEQKFGLVKDYVKPREDSYHPTKSAGEQTHYGDQTLVLMESLKATGTYDRADFASRWRVSWNGYEDYLDHATKETLGNLVMKGSGSEELGGAARIAPLLAKMHGQPLEAKIAAARSQTELTHGSAIAVDSAEFLTRIVEGILDGAEVWAAVEDAAKAGYVGLPAGEIVQKAIATRGLDMKAAGKELGLACPADQAVPTLLALLIRYPDDLETAFIENVMVGGDSAARGLALGMILGARQGKSGIPERWINGLKAAPRVEAFLGAI